jgi:hypothetical protein
MNPEGPRKKIFSLAVRPQKYFLPTHFVNPIQDYYICKPDTGLSLTSVNFFQDGSYLYSASVRAYVTQNTATSPMLQRYA